MSRSQERRGASKEALYSLWLYRRQRGGFAAVTKSGAALEHATAHLRADRDVVLMAVATDGAALQYAAKPLRADRGLVLTACVGPNAFSMHALRWAAPHLRDDRELVALCIEASRGWARGSV